ncbi:MAG: 2-amino-4-hydroxy-6-hydroxymethyldihydropteridine diphosphokinase [Pseudomonadota bacterium]
MSELYLIALGSNVRVPGLGLPRVVLEAAFEALDSGPARLIASSSTIETAPIGPSLRRYANAAAVIETPLRPPSLLAHLKRIEDAFGRGRAQRRGARWRARSLDLDIILWSGGVWHSPELAIPHRLFRERDFVVRPAKEIAPHWRDEISALSLAQLAARLNRARAG